MITEKRVTEILKEAGVLLEGHFLLTSGRHSGTYLQCAKIFQNSKYAGELCAALAESFTAERIDVVVGPAMGAVLMAYELSRKLGCKNYFTERENGRMALRRGFEIKPGDRILLVEDVITTGGSVMETFELIKSLGGDIIGIASIVDRSGGKASFPVPFTSVIKMDVESFDPGDCPICARGAGAPVKPGSRK
ncbi:MAG: orotate phosphoribosyltransferase [Clostridiales bacterium]|nr:orotate phosphoribosyltransferase [Clostridiales bacterium]